MHVSKAAGSQLDFMAIVCYLRHMMKVRVLMTLFASAGLAKAELDLPKGLFSAEEIDQAKTEALDKKKPVAFLVSQRSLTPS